MVIAVVGGDAVVRAIEDASLPPSTLQIVHQDGAGGHSVEVVGLFDGLLGPELEPELAAEDVRVVDVPVVVADRAPRTTVVDLGSTLAWRRPAHQADD